MILIDNACSSLQGLWVCSVSRVIPDGEQTNTKGEDKERILHKILETSRLKMFLFNDVFLIAIIAISIDLLAISFLKTRASGALSGPLYTVVCFYDDICTTCFYLIHHQCYDSHSESLH